MTIFDDLRAHRAGQGARRIMDLFGDPGRAEAFSRKAEALERDIDRLAQRRAALIALSRCDCAEPARCPQTLALSANLAGL